MAILRGWRLTRRGVLFFAGVLILAGLLFGAIYFVHERAEQARRAEAVKIAEQNLEDQSQPATETTPAAEEGSNSNGAVAVNESEVTPSNEEAMVPELPATGADLQSLFIVTILALGSAFYITSRRAVRDL